MSFFAGQNLTAAALNSAIGFGTGAQDSQATSGTTTSTTYTATLTGGTACGLAFVAPASGKVLIANSMLLVQSTGSQIAYCTIRVRTGSSIGSGSDVVAAADNNSITAVAVFVTGIGRVIPVSGLTPGASYNVQQLFRVSANTGTYSGKSLSVAATT